ncbi:hypothetical protein ACQPXM_13285 [Kribbella sp. CA-253562]|uniref:hypothetical protein n=1 Tax=Kribbella sp. CA-253562 TaxID=3239942 RepID=UPI003D90F51D
MEVMEMVAAKLATGSVPMNFQHDPSRPLHPENVEAGVERLEDGHWAVWAEFDIDEDAWRAYQSEVEAAGAPGGMSITVTSPLPDLPGDADIWVFADAHHFSDDDLRSVVQLLKDKSGQRSSAMRLYQFSNIPEARVVFDMLYSTVMALGPNVVASYIYDALKGMGRLGKKTVVEPYFRRESDGAVEAGFRVETADPAVAMLAMTEMGRLLDSGVKGVFRFDGSSSFVEVVKPRPEIDGEDQD